MVTMKSHFIHFRTAEASDVEMLGGHCHDLYRLLQYLHRLANHAYTQHNPTSHDILQHQVHQGLRGAHPLEL